MPVLKGAREDNVLTALVWSKEACTEIALRVTPATFSTRGYKAIAEKAIAYVQKYKQPGGNHIRDELDDRMQGSSSEAKFLIQTFEAMDVLRHEINPQYILDHLQHFIETQTMLFELAKAAADANAGDLDSARKHLRAAMVDKEFKHGTWLNKPDEALRFLDKDEEHEFFPSGVEELDRRGCHPRRKTMFLGLAPSNRGKSWWLIEIGKQCAYIYNKSVLHITLEMSEEKVSARYIQAMFAMARGKDVENIASTTFQKDGYGKLVGFDHGDTRTAIGIRKETKPRILDRMKKFASSKPILIKEFPTGGLTIEMLEAYLDLLEQQYNFVPDILILDYPDLMDIDSGNLRIDLGRLFIKLRGLVIKRDMALATMTQGNRKSAGAKTTRETDIGEDWSKVQTADMLVTYSQTDTEEKRGFARLLVEKNREDIKHYTVLISQHYPTGQFCLDSVLMTKDAAERTKATLENTED